MSPQKVSLRENRRRSRQQRNPGDSEPFAAEYVPQEKKQDSRHRLRGDPCGGAATQSLISIHPATTRFVPVLLRPLSAIAQSPSSTAHIPDIRRGLK